MASRPQPPKASEPGSSALHCFGRRLPQICARQVILGSLSKAAAGGWTLLRRWSWGAAGAAVRDGAGAGPGCWAGASATRFLGPGQSPSGALASSSGSVVVIAVALKYCRYLFAHGVGRNSRDSNDYSCCGVPQSRIRTMRDPQSVLVAQMRCTCCARVGPTEAFLMSASNRYLKVGPRTRLFRWIFLPDNFCFCQILSGNNFSCHFSFWREAGCLVLRRS